MIVQFNFTRYKTAWIFRAIVSASMLLSLPVQAQTVLDTARTWTSTQQIDLYSSQTIADTVTVYLSNNTVRLTHQDVVREFPVSTITGSWTNITQPGEITFNVQVLTLAGKGKLTRESGALSLTIDLSERQNWMKRKFILNPQQP